MNPNNYCTLEASKRLVEAGIKIKTEFYHVFSEGQYLGIHHKKYRDGFLKEVSLDHADVKARDFIPAPSMAEVWRELPEKFVSKRGRECILQLDKVKTVHGVVDTSAQYVYGEHFEYVYKFFADTNPTDALIDLLIWVRKEE